MTCLADAVTPSSTVQHGRVATEGSRRQSQPQELAHQEGDVSVAAGGPTRPSCRVFTLNLPPTSGVWGSYLVYKLADMDSILDMVNLDNLGGWSLEGIGGNWFIKEK